MDKSKGKVLVPLAAGMLLSVLGGLLGILRIPFQVISLILLALTGIMILKEENHVQISEELEESGDELETAKKEILNLHTAMATVDEQNKKVEVRAGVISGQVQEINASMQEVTAATSQIDMDIHLVSDSIDIIADASDSISGYTESMKERAEALKSTAENHKSNTGQVVQTIVAKLQTAIENSRNVEKVNQLTNEILSISSQTNLLALNASIEAARAGEAFKANKFV